MKKKMRAFACAAATTLAIVPFLSGCSADNANGAGDNAGENAAATTTEQQQSGSDEAAEVVKYGQVTAVNGDEVTVVLGELNHPNDGEEQTFTSGEDKFTFDRTGVDFIDSAGGMLDPDSLTVGNVVILKGVDENGTFKPAVVEMSDLPFEAGDQSR